MDMTELEEFQKEVVDLCKDYFAGDNDSLTTSDFQGCLEGLINKYKED